MKDREFQFLKGVLGNDGAQALKKAGERDARVSTALMPRTILGWLNLAARFQYEGDLPGVENTYFSVKKAELGYSGAISIGDDVFTFDRASLFHVAASVSVALGTESTKPDPALKDAGIQRLGKSIDTLIKARVACQELKRSKKKKDDKEVKKDEPGQAVKPAAQSEAQAPTAPQFQPQQPRPPKPKGTLKIAKSQSERCCSMCNRPQFQGGRLRACLCFRDAIKDVGVREVGDSYLLNFGPSWDEDAIAAFSRVFR